ncbi:hypothetical protein EJ02DRAFT_92371 [Clathrospora elynae]|uniref:Uncharacterized protein n=1 Tax=Clathrospora elynae TaxID=706981 RepID=A0A6A5T631_9PLEO|nr:hypothetical protein EJ02DRAFT_92371 [Clathrospora elynae]
MPKSSGDVLSVDVIPNRCDSTWGETARTNNNTTLLPPNPCPRMNPASPPHSTPRDSSSGTQIRGLVSCAAISGESDACNYPTDTFRTIFYVKHHKHLSRRAGCSKPKSTAPTYRESMVLNASMSGHVNAQNSFLGSAPGATNPNPCINPRPVVPPIKMNTVSPGHIDTPLSKAARKRGLTEEWVGQNM